MADDREPESEAAIAPPRAPLLLAKAIEDVRQELWRDADAAVGDAHLDMRPGFNEAQDDASTFRRELGRVREQVPHHLLQPLWIAGNRRRVRVDRGLEADV